MRRLVRADPDDRWAAVFGRIAVYSFLVALVTGIFLLPFFQPSMTPVVYHGSYRKLDGLTMSRAYQSALNISFDVRGGLLIRQVHHWSADLFVAAVCLRLVRVFFRGRFRRPDWLIWVGLLPAGMLAGWSGAILPDDMLSGGSLSVLTGVIDKLPQKLIDSATFETGVVHLTTQRKGTTEEEPEPFSLAEVNRELAALGEAEE